MIETNNITLSTGNNYFTSDKLNISLIKKGYVPTIRPLTSTATANSVSFSAKIKNETYPDYYGYNVTLNEALTGFTNLKKLIIISTGFKTSNLAVQFGFDDPTLANLTLTYAYKTFGSYLPYLNTQYFGNLFGTQSSKVINIRNIDSYPIQSKIVFFLIESIEIYV